MSIYDKASLVLIPSGTKTSKVYSQKPTSGDGDFTFSRSTAATRVNADGVIEKETQNLLLQSNSFDTTWSSGNITLTSGQNGYNGSSDAWKAQFNGPFKNIGQTISSSGINTFSLYAKAGDTEWVRLSTDGTSTRVFFNIPSDGSGSIGLEVGVVDSKIQYISNGWYRCSIVVNGAITAAKIIGAIADNDTNANGEYCYIQSAQLESGLVATTYLDSGATTAKAGILEDMPRIDYTSGTGALLLEPLRSNLLPQSEYFGAKWTLIQSVKSDGVLSPSGELTAVTITDDGLGGSSSNVRIQADNFTISASTKYTFSAYVKANPNTIIKVTTRNDDALRGGTFNISNLTFTAEQGTETGNVKDFGNGFYRISTTWTSGSDTSIGIGIGFPNVTRDGTNSFTLWGAQCEAGNYVSSYIPTYGSAVTRSADAFTRTGISSLINSQEGTLFVEMAAFSSNPGTTLLSLSDGSTSNNIYIGYTSTTNQISAVIYAGGSAQAAINIFSYDIKQSNKIALSYKTNEVKLYINGSLAGTDTSATMPSANTLNKFSSDFGQGSFKLAAELKQAIIFDSALTQSEAEALTTL